MMISGDWKLSAVKFERQLVARLYTPELRIRSHAATASAQRCVPGCRPAVVTDPLYTCALTYILASIASAAPFVKRPFLSTGHFDGNTSPVSFNSFSINENTSARSFFAPGLM